MVTVGRPPCALGAHAGIVMGQIRPDMALARLHGVPELLLDDAQGRDILDDPLRLRVHPRLALARRRILDEALAVPHETSDIELVVEDAVAALPVAVDGRRVPGAALRTGDALAIEFDRDVAR